MVPDNRERCDQSAVDACSVRDFARFCEILHATRLARDGCQGRKPTAEYLVRFGIVEQRWERMKDSAGREESGPVAFLFPSLSLSLFLADRKL